MSTKSAQTDTPVALVVGRWKPFRNGGVLLLPILVWNAVFTGYLPPALGSVEFWRDIPPAVVYGENAFRLAVVALPFLMPIELSTVGERRGIVVFVVGVVIYFAAWIPLMLAPDSAWSTNWIGFLAPAYTPLLWLTGIGLACRRLYWRLPYRFWMYIALSFAFVAFHLTHAAVVYSRVPISVEP